MYNIEYLSDEELRMIKKQLNSSYWGSIVTIIVGFFVVGIFVEDRPLWIFLTLFVCFVFLIPKFFVDNPIKGNVKIIRRNIITKVKYEKYKRAVFLSITLEDDIIPVQYPIYVFDIYKFVSEWPKVDRVDYRNYRELVGREIEIEYLPESGLLLSAVLIAESPGKTEDNSI